MKVLQLFVNILIGDPSYINLKHTLQEKFLLMDSSTLASWLEKMLLGYTAQSAVGNFIKLVLHKNLSLTLDLFWTFQGHAFVC